MPDARRDEIDAIIGRSLLTAEVLASELRARIVEEIATRRDSLSDGALLTLARNLLEDVDPVLVQVMTDAEVAAWVAGASAVEGILPALAREALEGPPAPPFGLTSLMGGGEEPVVRFPLIERAAESLLERDIVTRNEFDQMGRLARSRAFTVAQQESEDAIRTIRDTLAETTTEGASYQEFRKRLGEDLDGSFIGPAHRELVFRNAVQSSFTNGHDSLAENPVVEEVFPFREYLPIRDGRVRENHLALATLGLDGTSVYWASDPFWRVFRIPWEHNCRCGSNLLTVDAAARKGVVAARRWLRTGERPPMESRLPFIPFRPDPDFAGAA